MRGLVYFWRAHLAVTLGAAVACAVLTGALVVGDSVRGSLAALVLDRLGNVDQAVVSSGFVRPDLAGGLAAAAEGLVVEPVVLMRGSVTHRSRGVDSDSPETAERQLRASNVQVFGVGPSFSALFPDGPAISFERSDGQVVVGAGAVVNESLARELELAPGDTVLVSVERPAEVPRETLVGRADAAETIERLRASVVAIVPDSGVGGFRLSPQQAAPLNLFVERDRLQRALFGRGHDERVNTLLVSRASRNIRNDGPGNVAGGGDISRLLSETVALDDLSLLATPTETGAQLGSRQFVLADATTTAVTHFAEERGLGVRPSLTYLANSLDSANGSVPYSTLTGLDPASDDSPLPALVLTTGERAPALADDEILIDAWAAEDLGSDVGQSIELTYFELGARDELSEKTVTLRLAGVVALEGPAIDPGLTPEFPGMADADDIAAWDPPFPVELARVRDRDEEYWDLYRAAPKAFVSLATARKLWASRFGHTTTLEIAPAEDQSVAELGTLLHTELPKWLMGEAGGAQGGGGASGALQVLDLRADGLAAAKGATDFGGLFLALSFFLIGSAALLVALLFRLGVEQRAREVGLLRAVGFPEAKVRRRFLIEGVVLAALGSGIGVAAAAGYAAAMLAALGSWWLGAVGTTGLELHLTPASLAIGWLASVLTVAFTLWLALRNLRRVPAPSLLAGSVEVVRTKAPRLSSRVVAWSTGFLALALLASAPLLGSQALPLITMGVGFLLLIAGIAGFAHRLGGRRNRAGQPVRSANRLTSKWTTSPVLAMGARNSARNAGRSLASVALIASAVFLLVIVGANRRSGVVDVDALDSGAGGFRLLAESDIPVLADLNDPERRSELGFSSTDSNELAQASIVPLRRLPGEDASCLNLYRPGRPSVLGVPDEMIARGGFAFQSIAEEVDNPWTLLEGELEPGVIPAFADYNSAVWILHLGLGKDLVIEDQTGQELRLRLVGLLHKSLFQSEVLISEANFTAHFPRQTGYSFFLVESPAGDDAAQARITELLESRLDSFGFDVTSSAERIAAFQAVENTYIATFQTLGGLGLLLGTIGLGVVLLRNVLERRGELATLRAFGFRRDLLAKMVLAENGVLLVIGIAIGTVAGLVGVLPNLLSEGHQPPGWSLAGVILLVFVVGMAASAFAVAATVGRAGASLLPALKGD